MHRAILMSLPVHVNDAAARAWRVELNELAGKGWARRSETQWCPTEEGIAALKAAGSGTHPIAPASWLPPAPIEKTTSVVSRIPESVSDAIDLAAAAGNTTRSDVVRKILEREFGHASAPTVTRRPASEPKVRVRLPMSLVPPPAPGQSQAAAVAEALARLQAVGEN